MSKKQVSETQALLTKGQEHTQFTHRDLHESKEAGRERAQVALAGRQKLNEVTKKYIRAE